jgi:hypothetical protein
MTVPKRQLAIPRYCLDSSIEIDSLGPGTGNPGDFSEDAHPAASAMESDGMSGVERVQNNIDSPPL